MTASKILPQKPGLDDLIVAYWLDRFKTLTPQQTKEYMSLGLRQSLAAALTLGLDPVEAMREVMK